jgi:hypothetical protein
MDATVVTWDFCGWNFCARCGRKLEASFSFCPGCGFNLWAVFPMPFAPTVCLPYAYWSTDIKTT